MHWKMHGISAWTGFNVVWNVLKNVKIVNIRHNNKCLDCVADDNWIGVILGSCRGGPITRKIWMRPFLFFVSTTISPVKFLVSLLSAAKAGSSSPNASLDTRLPWWQSAIFPIVSFPLVEGYYWLITKSLTCFLSLALSPLSVSLRALRPGGV